MTCPLNNKRNVNQRIARILNQKINAVSEYFLKPDTKLAIIVPHTLTKISRTLAHVSSIAR